MGPWRPSCLRSLSRAVVLITAGRPLRARECASEEHGASALRQTHCPGGRELPQAGTLMLSHLLCLACAEAHISLLIMDAWTWIQLSLEPIHPWTFPSLGLTHSVCAPTRMCVSMGILTLATKNPDQPGAQTYVKEAGCKSPPSGLCLAGPGGMTHTVTYSLQQEAAQLPSPRQGRCFLCSKVSGRSFSRGPSWG